MTAQDFDALLDRRLALTRGVLAAKAGEYASDKDRLHNFKSAALLSCQSPEQALAGMWMKHVVSVLDMVRALEYGVRPSRDRVDEKIGDAINYLALLEGLFVERMS